MPQRRKIAWGFYSDNSYGTQKKVIGFFIPHPATLSTIEHLSSRASKDWIIEELPRGVFLGKPDFFQRFKSANFRLADSWLKEGEGFFRFRVR